MQKLLDDFNGFFAGSARVVIADDRMEITIGSQTLIISLPQIIGAQAKGSS